MQILFIVPTILAFMIWPYLTGVIAKTFGRKFWIWFALGLAFPFISLVILHCLPGRSKKKIADREENVRALIFKKLKRSA